MYEEEVQTFQASLEGLKVEAQVALDEILFHTHTLRLYII
jgi:hypothetical protein